MAYKGINEIIGEYNDFVTRAKNVYAANGGRHTEEERAFYESAEERCNELRIRFAGQPTESANWEERARKCRAMLKKIDNELNPLPSPKSTAASSMSSANATGTQKSTGAHSREEKQAPAKTDGEFVTNNARDEVPSEMIERWFKESPNHDMSDVTGMGNIKSVLASLTDDALWEKTIEAVRYETEHGILFYGPPGTGKTYIIEAFIAELIKRGYKYIQLLGGDISSSLVGVAEKIIETAMSEAIDKSPCVVFIDEIDAVCKERTDPSAKSHEKNLTDSFLQAYNKVISENKPVLLLTATNHLELVDKAMKDRMSKIYVGLPETEARAEYFEKQFDGITLEDGLTFSYMAEKTDGSSYRALSRLCNGISLELKKNAKASVGVREDELDAFGDGKNGYTKELDNAASENVITGNVKLTREIFDRKLEAPM